ncbi:hypothetical protein BT69DRAFT_1289530 [Atractiella rhizophila]|nr:hypothetical protein BT69DRAFT_1289530 [Atractiella rhizophila]
MTKRQELQRSVILDCLSGTDHFKDVGDDLRYANCQRSIKQIIMSLSQLSQAWQVCLSLLCMTGVSMLFRMSSPGHTS